MNDNVTAHRPPPGTDPFQYTNLIHNVSDFSLIWINPMRVRSDNVPPRRSETSAATARLSVARRSDLRHGAHPDSALNEKTELRPGAVSEAAAPPSGR